MSDFLYEAMQLDLELPESKLKHLDEYLIQTESLTIAEAKELLKLTLLELQSIQNSLADRVKGRYDKMNKIAAKFKTKKEANAYIKAETKNIQDWANRLRKVADTGAGSKMDKIKLALTRVGRGSVGTKLSKTKIGAIAAGAALTAGGGYAGYKALKNRKAKATA